MTQADAALAGDFEVIKETARQHAGEFLAWGFEFSGATWEGSPKLRRYPIFKFLNPTTGMEIHILFSSAREGRNGGFVVTIVKPGDHVLNVKDYLKLHGFEDPTPLFRYRDSNTDIRVFAQAFFQMLSGLLREQLAPILRNEIWEDTPIDWQGYK